MDVLLVVLSIIIAAFGVILYFWDGTSSPISAAMFIVLIWKCYYDYNRNKETKQRLEELSEVLSNKDSTENNAEKSEKQ
ncbi:MAG TPA: hypothetical protein DCR23_06895 [Ruminococcaceae bacterium]|nr:hypothetical protein [Oscillospiraceae bacterium]